MHIEYFLLAMVAIAAITDLAQRKIPNVLIVWGLGTSLMLQVFLPIHGSAWHWLSGCITGFALFLPFYVVRGMGAGDVKLMAAVGSFAGPLLTFKIALATFIIGGILSLAVALIKRNLRGTLSNVHRILRPSLFNSGPLNSSGNFAIQSTGRIPYGVAIALGTITMLYFEKF
ncbi:prepilin peptidase [Oxalobacteraceae bacterium R-40]|uniref:Prepilin peptidase n=1 Tax=Keguizhuia sedimenti TaxID=3064264 RepID=A0ABU1BJD0_9BURK|nr:prepilin peptidase [Oxalobacteraceae bacterium R-40]